MIWVGIGLVLWLGCGVLGAGFEYAWFQRSYPTIADEMRAGDVLNARFGGFGGPLTLIAFIFFLDGRPFKGWLLPGRKP